MNWKHRLRPSSALCPTSPDVCQQLPIRVASPAQGRNGNQDSPPSRWQMEEEEMPERSDNFPVRGNCWGTRGPSGLSLHGGESFLFVGKSASHGKARGPPPGLESSLGIFLTKWLKAGNPRLPCSCTRQGQDWPQAPVFFHQLEFEGAE